MTDFIANPVIAVLLTVGLYFAAQLIQKKTGLVVLNPILLAVCALIAILLVFNVPFDKYYEGGRSVEFFLKPAIVALGVPLYEQLEKIRKQAIPILVSQAVACFTGAVSATMIAVWSGATDIVAISLAPKSATTPIAMEVTRLTGGIPALSAVIVILTGILGAMCGLQFLKLVGIRSRIARGLSMGAAAHAVGTAHSMSVNRRLGVYSSVGLIINGTFTGVLTPYILHLLGF